jgi:hypothetical protein
MKKKPLTEADWSACQNPKRMLPFLKKHASERKQRLFACACCRLIWPLLTEQLYRKVVEAAEQCAEGMLTMDELRNRTNWASARRGRERQAVVAATVIEAGRAAEESMYETREVAFLAPESPLSDIDLRPMQASLLHDILGNPFRPLEARNFPSHVVGLAQACYESFPAVSDQFLILADALEELEEGHAAAHCREKVHVKGCHVLDWILGKA